MLDNRSLAFIGSVTAAVLAGIYVIWGPSEKSRRRNLKNRKSICPGLVNLGNTCFLNAILQALSPCLGTLQWLEFLTSDNNVFKRCLARTLHSVLKVLNNDSIEYTNEYCPSNVIESLQSHGWVIPSDEQDAYELYHVVMETLTEESLNTPTVISLFDINSVESSTVLRKEEAVNRIGTQLPILLKGEFQHPFHGLLASQLRCRSCNHKFSMKYDVFDSLSLSLPQHGPLSLDALLQRYVMSESIDGVSCEKCDGASRSFVKKMTIGKLPKCLCIHIQRTVWLSNGMPMKRCDKVRFPELLNMTPYVYHKKDLSKTRPGNLDLEGRQRLVGGRRQAKNSNFKCSSVKSMTVPYSGPVNMLKALNFQPRLAYTGLYSLGHISPDACDRQLQRLAQAYSEELLTNATPQSGAYKLTSVIVHLGDVTSGHFITYRRVPSVNGQRFPDQWLQTSDVSVRKANVSEVLSSNAYMLFYEKI